MHYYTFHPKDYMSKTKFLEPMEDLAYRRMLDYQYLNESPLPTDVDEIAFLIDMRTHSDSIAIVLRYFFDITDDGYINDRAEQEIAKYQEKSEKARKSANARWNKKQPKASKGKGLSEYDANALQAQSEGNANQQQETINDKQETINDKQDLDGFDDVYLRLKNKLRASGVIPIGKPVIDEHLKPDIYQFVNWCNSKNMEAYKQDNAVVAFFKKKDIEDRKKYYTPADDLSGRYFNADDYQEAKAMTDEEAEMIKAKHANTIIGLGF